MSSREAPPPRSFQRGIGEQPDHRRYAEEEDHRVEIGEDEYDQG